MYIPVVERTRAGSRISNFATFKSCGPELATTRFQNDCVMSQQSQIIPLGHLTSLCTCIHKPRNATETLILPLVRSSPVQACRWRGFDVPFTLVAIPGPRLSDRKGTLWMKWMLLDGISPELFCSSLEDIRNAKSVCHRAFQHLSPQGGLRHMKGKAHSPAQITEATPPSKRSAARKHSLTQRNITLHPHIDFYSRLRTTRNLHTSNHHVNHCRKTRRARALQHC
jgi:hypothetical protein